MEKFDEYEYAALNELATELKEQYLEEELVKPVGILDPAGCSLEEPCSKCEYDSVIERLAEMETQLQ